MTDISIVTATYNRTAFLSRVWQSLCNQHVDFEWVVADDGSTDDTPSVVQGFHDPRVVYVRLPVNRGANTARNAGVRAAHGRYVVLLDNDDELYPGILTRMLEVMDAADKNVGACAFACVTATGQRISRVAHNSVFDERQVVCRGALRQELVYIYRREVFTHFELPEDLVSCESVFVYHVSQRYRYLAMDEPGRIMHWHGSNLSGADSLIGRSRDIAVSYERILANHAAILAQETKARSRFLQKAMYRYNIAGLRRDAWRVYRQLITRSARPMHWLFASALFLFSMMVPRRFERWRICHAQRGMAHTGIR